MKNLHKYVAAALFLTFASCQGISNSIKETVNGPSHSSEEDASTSLFSKDPKLVTDTVELQKAESKLRNLPHLKGKQLKVCDELYIYSDGRINIHLQDPDTLQNVNAYWYNVSNNEWSAPQPVQLSADDLQQMKEKSISLDSIPFIRAAQIAKVFNDKARSVGSESTLKTIYYIPEAHQWYCDEIQTPRANYEMYFNADGTVKEFSQE